VELSAAPSHILVRAVAAPRGKRRGHDPRANRLARPVGKPSDIDSWQMAKLFRFTSVLKDRDGSYDGMGTKAGATVKLGVSVDLATIRTPSWTAGPPDALTLVRQDPAPPSRARAGTSCRRGGETGKPAACPSTVVQIDRKGCGWPALP
jgi:hypothetical protein